jgi:flagellar basal body rod protein FlgG
MSGSQYIALSGLRARVDDLDRLADDIANVGTSGYKGQREARASAERAIFADTLATAIDTTYGGQRLDVSAGAFAMTGRDLDVAIDGDGFFVVDTASGPRYTRNGHFTMGADRKLVAEDGAVVHGEGGGPITIGEGDLRIDQDGTIWTGEQQAGKLAVVTFDHPDQLVREQGARLRADGQTANPAKVGVVRGGALEQSNVSVAGRLAELTTVQRSFEALQKAIGMLMNDVDGRAIDHLGRR